MGVDYGQERLYLGQIVLFQQAKQIKMVHRKFLEKLLVNKRPDEGKITASYPSKANSDVRIFPVLIYGAQTWPLTNHHNFTHSGRVSEAWSALF